MKRRQLEVIYGGRYEKIHAISTDFYNTCYYCGETATTLDHVPSLANVEFYIATEIPADFALVPCCRECNLLAGDENHPDIEDRLDFVKKKLKKRYGKQYTRAKLWTDEEVSDLESEDGETSISRSIRATLTEGERILSRINFNGYAYEMRGIKNKARAYRARAQKAFGVEYKDFKSALHAVAAQYRVNINALYNTALTKGGDLEKAVEEILSKVETALEEKRINSLCESVADTYRQPVAWVKRSFKAIRNKHKTLSDTQCIDKLIHDYIR